MSYASAKSFLAGAISGAVAKTAVAPFDRTKILMQVSQMYGWERYRGSVWDSMRTIWRTEGIPGFFRGNSATVVRIMPYAAVQYSSFEFYHRTLSVHVFQSEKPSPLKRFIAGAMAGSTSVLCTYPIDLARTVLAVQVANEGAAKPLRRLGIFATLYTISRDQGITSMYRGMYPTLVGVIPYAGISFLSFGVLKRKADRRGYSQRAPVLTSLICGGAAGLSTFHFHCLFVLLQARLGIVCYLHSLPLQLVSIPYADLFSAFHVFCTVAESWVIAAQCCTYPFDLVRRRLQALHTPDLMTKHEKVRRMTMRSLVPSLQVSDGVLCDSTLTCLYLLWMI